MLVHSLLVLHIVVLGYWLGAELVINSTYRYVAWAREMSFHERDRLMDHVMNADQHVRYALLLQLALGFALLFLLGYLPGGALAAWAAGAVSVAWLWLVEVTHRMRKSRRGQALAKLDRGLRYAVICLLVILAVSALWGKLDLRSWVAWKLLVFAGVMACGVGIRLVLLGYFKVWKSIEAFGTDDSTERRLRRYYGQATGILILLWVFIAAAVALSVLKPGF